MDDPYAASKLRSRPAIIMKSLFVIVILDVHEKLTGLTELYSRL